jgi:predicted transcriptional regulator
LRRSTLEMCVGILDVLSINGQLKITHVMNKTSLNCITLREQLDFLASNGLIEERSIQKKRSLKKGPTFYAITQRGQIVLKTFRELNKLLPIEDSEEIVCH